MYFLHTGKHNISVGNITFYLWKSVQNIKFMKLVNLVPFRRPQSGTVIIQLMTELGVSNR